MTRFFFENQLGRVSLNGDTGVLLQNVYGLGFSRTDDYADLRNGFFARLSSDKEEQLSSGGTLKFNGNNPYNDYLDFLSWLASSENLFFVYKPYSVEYTRRVNVRSVTKADMTDSTRRADIELSVMSPWYKAEKLNIAIAPAPVNVSRFGTAVFGEDLFATAYNQAFSATIQPAGHLPAALDFDFTGAVENPTLVLTGIETGKEYGRLTVETTLTAGDKIEYSSDPYDSYIRKISGGVVSDLMDSVVPGSNSFFSIPTTEPTELKFDGDEDPDGTANAAVRYFYRSV